MFTINGKYTSALVTIDNVEEECISQITAMTNHPTFTKPIAIMPDTHAGKGSVIGFTMPLSDTIIPNIVGVDIGCGMLSVNIGKQPNLNLEELDSKIREVVPFGYSINTHAQGKRNLVFWNWRTINEQLRQTAMHLSSRFGFTPEYKPFDIRSFYDIASRVKCPTERVRDSIGTLGGGNHFIEVGKDINDDIWITVHSGSRNLGKCICEYWQNIAVEVHKLGSKIEDRIADIKANNPPQKYQLLITLMKQDLQKFRRTGTEYLSGDNLVGYLMDMVVAQWYAETNRSIMMGRILSIIPGEVVHNRISSIHNYIDFNDWIIRKGSIASYKGCPMIIPFNMRDGILVCEGKSNPEWNFSAPHGAGRVMSRTDAKASLSMAEFTEQMKGICSSSVCQSTLDEAPGAYKEASLIENAIGPTATIINRIKPILNLKSK